MASTDDSAHTRFEFSAGIILYRNKYLTIGRDPLKKVLIPPTHFGIALMSLVFLAHLFIYYGITKIDPTQICSYDIDSSNTLPILW